MLGFLKNLFAPSPPQRPAEPTRQQAIASARAGIERVMTPERAELIQNALKVRAAKQSILADLSDSQRQRMVVEAMRFFLNQEPEPEAKKSSPSKASLIKDSRTKSSGTKNSAAKRKGK